MSSDLPVDPVVVTRRVALQRAGLVAGAAGVAWAAPAVTTLGARAFAAGSPVTFVFDPSRAGLVDTGLDLRPGSNTVSVTGRARPGGPNDTTAGYDADGKPGTQNDPNKYGDLPYPSGNYFVVYGSIGPAGPLFAIGTGATVTGPGRLYVGYNDDGFSDNTGAFSVAVTP